MMMDIDGVLVSTDVAERYFCCDLDKCHGQCCIDGDAGAPVTEEEENIIRDLLPVVEEELAPQAQKVIKDNGLTYHDIDGELVLQTVEDANCIFTCMAPGGTCLCAIDRACRQGKTGGWPKPISCDLYPLRLRTLPGGTVAVNYDRRKLCRPGEKKGRNEGIRVYEFLEQPLRRRFGDAWYEELSQVCSQWNNQQSHE